MSMSEKTIDISGPLKTLAYGIAFAILTTLASFVIKNISVNQVSVGDYITINAEIRHAYYIEDKGKYLVEVLYDCDGTQYIAYVYSDAEVHPGGQLVMEYDKNHNQKCCYESKEYMAQSLVSHAE